VGAVALVAGATAPRAVILGVAMTALQVAIGSLNDLVDAPLDAGRKPGKPIPSGLVTTPAAWTLVVGGTVVGVVLSVLGAAPGAGVVLLGLAGLVLAIGFAYDLWAKGTPWSWLPFALGIPLLPVFGWYGASGSLPSWFAALVPTAAIAGSALAIANARADLERDADAGARSVAIRLGADRSWRIHAVLWVVVVAIAIGWLVVLGSDARAVVAVGAAAALVLVGVVVGRQGSPARRERAWEIESIAGVALAVTWLLAVGSTP
jgi:4-hydroxybenzoate polyprenyltransferase